MDRAMMNCNFDTANVTSKYVANKPFYDFVKRFADIICSAIGIILLSPFFIIISIAIKLTSRGPVIFVH